MELETELKQMIVEALMLEDTKPEDIVSDAPLFGEGLGLDSIDALELAMAIDNKYGVRIRADDENARAVFTSVKSLSEHISQHRTKP